MGDNGTCIEKRLVGELLSFVAYKLNWMAPDTIIQLCSSFYSDEAVDNAKPKAHLYERCADSADKKNLDETAEVGDNGTCIEKRLVVDELLSFVAYKLNWMAPDNIKMSGIYFTKF